MNFRHGYPVVLRLEKQRCVVAGGGPPAEEKILGLLEAGADLTVVAERLTPALHTLAAQGRFRWIGRKVAAGDLAGAFLAVAADEDRSVNAALSEEATREHVLFNALDDPQHCGFIYPSVLRRGALAIAISTMGLAPALAVRLRQRFGEQIGPEYAAFLELAGEFRESIARTIPDPVRRKNLWYEIVDSGVIELLRQGRDEEAKIKVAEFITAARYPE